MITIGFLALGATIIALIILSSMWLKPLHIPHGTRGTSATTDQTATELSFELLFMALVGGGIGSIVGAANITLLHGIMAGGMVLLILDWLMLPRQLWLPGAISYGVSLCYGISCIKHDLFSASIAVGTFLAVCLVGAITYGPLAELTKKKA